MKTTVNATYSNGKFTPALDLDLEDGAEVSLTIESEPQLTMEERVAITKLSAGGWMGLRDPDEFKRAIYEVLRRGEATSNLDNLAPSPEEARRALNASSGAWKGKHDPDALIGMIYEARLTGSRAETEL